MSAPWPPSPPEGPPRGTYFSLRNATQPLPPGPPVTRILASSANTDRPPYREMEIHTQKGYARLGRNSEDVFVLATILLQHKHQESYLCAVFEREPSWPVRQQKSFRAGPPFPRPSAR